MSRFKAKRSLKQLYIEKHAVELMIHMKKDDIATKRYKPTARQMADLQSEEAFLKEILNDIELAEEIVKRHIDEPSMP